MSLKVKSISASKHKLGDFAFTTIYISSIDKKNSEVYASIICELYLVDKLKAIMLMGNNVLCIEGFTINLSTSFALIYSCNVNININAREHSEFLRQMALASALTIVPS